MANKITMGASSEVFPDLHHKMSKKIAQLTKVIYHLNTRNEDHQSGIKHHYHYYHYQLLPSFIHSFHFIIIIHQTL